MQTRIVLFANTMALVITAFVVCSSHGEQNAVKSTSFALRSVGTGEIEEQDFAFAISHFNSSRQWGKCNRIAACILFALA